MKRPDRFARVLGEPKKSIREWEEQARSRHPFPVGQNEGDDPNPAAFNRQHMQWALDAALHQAYISGLVQGVHEMETMAIFVQMHVKSPKVRKLLREYIDEIKRSIAEGRKGTPR